MISSFPKTDNLKSSSLISFSNASLAKLKCSAPQDSLMIFSEGSNGKYMPLAWQSRRLKGVVKRL